MIQSVSVIGVGGVGGFFGGKLCELVSEGVRVTFVARGEHLEAVRARGLLLSTESDGEVVCRPSVATDKIEEAGRADLILLCVKDYDLDDVLLRLKPLVNEQTVLLPLLNGMDVYQRVRKGLGRALC